MWSHYDEDVNDNPFFKEIVQNHVDILRKCCEDHWIVCVPRRGTFEDSPVSFEQILDHILVPEEGQFMTLSKKRVEVENKRIGLDNRVLFEETFYTDRTAKYLVWCIDRPLFTQYVCKNHQKIVLETIHDCVDFLWVESLTHRVLDDIQSLTQTFQSFESENLQTQKDLLGKLYSQCLQVCLKNHHLREKSNNGAFLDNLKVAVETYMHFCLGDRLIGGVNSVTCQIDSHFNKIVRNCGYVVLKDLGISELFSDVVVAIKCELNKINSCVTILDKVYCLLRTFRCVGESEVKQSVNADDLLRILVFAIVKLNVNNWWGNLYFIRHYRFSGANVGDQNDFMITSLEAALEFIRSTEFFDICNKRGPDVVSTQSQIQLLFDSVRLGNLGETKRLLNQDLTEKVVLCHPLCSCDKCLKNEVKIDLKTVNDKGQNLLIFASIYGQADLVDFFLSLGINPNTTDHLNKTALHYAVSKGHQHLIFLLICYGADVNTQDNEKNTPLYLAAENGHENCVKALIYAKPDLNLNLCNFFGDTPLHAAAKWGFLDVIKVLLENFANPYIKNRRNKTALDLCSNYYSRKLFEDFPDDNNNFDNTNNKDSDSDSSLEIIDYPNLEKKCENHGIKPQTIEQIKKIDLLLKAIENNDLPLTCFYLGYHNNNNKPTEETVKCHPLCNCDKCYSDPETTEKPKIAPILSVNTCNVFGYTPLHFAAKFGRLEILRLLLDSSASLNLKTYTTLYTALHLAVIHQRTKIVQELLNCGGCKVDEVDCKGNTPLYYAATEGYKKICELLLANGANGSHRNYMGNTILQDVEDKMLLGIVQLLKENNEENQKII